MTFPYMINMCGKYFNWLYLHDKVYIAKLLKMIIKGSIHEPISFYKFWSLFEPIQYIIHNPKHTTKIAQLVV